jgi:hypothetical protein
MSKEENGILKQLKKLLDKNTPIRIVLFTDDGKGIEGFLTRVEEDFIVLEERNGDLVEVEPQFAADPENPAFPANAETFTRLIVEISKIVSFGRELPQNG